MKEGVCLLLLLTSNCKDLGFVHLLPFSYKHLSIVPCAWFVGSIVLSGPNSKWSSPTKCRWCDGVSGIEPRCYTSYDWTYRLDTGWWTLWLWPHFRYHGCNQQQHPPGHFSTPGGEVAVWFHQDSVEASKAECTVSRYDPSGFHALYIIHLCNVILSCILEH